MLLAMENRRMEGLLAGAGADVTIPTGTKCKRKGVMSSDLIIYAVGTLIIIGAIYFLGSAILNLVKTSTATSEMHSIADQCQIYSGLRKDGALPTNLDVLLSDTAITSDESVSGQVYGNFLAKKGRWSGGQVVDPWNVTYGYTSNTDGTGTITSTGSGKTLSFSF